MLIKSLYSLFSILSASVSQIYGLGRGLGSTSYSLESRSDAIPVPMPAVGVVLEAFSRRLRKLFPLGPEANVLSFPALGLRFKALPASLERVTPPARMLSLHSAKKLISPMNRVSNCCASLDWSEDRL